MTAAQLLQAGIADMYVWWTQRQNNTSGYWAAVRDRWPGASEAALNEATDRAREAVRAGRNLTNRTTDRPLATADAPYRPSFSSQAGGALGKRWWYRVTVTYTVGGGPASYYTTFIPSSQSLGQATLKARAMQEVAESIRGGGGSPQPGQRGGVVNVIGAVVDTVFRF